MCSSDLKCQGELIRRPDDEPEVIQNRLDTYKKQTAPLIDFYKKNGLVKDVPCRDINQTANETAQSVWDAISEFMKDTTDEVKEVFGSPTKK